MLAQLYLVTPLLSYNFFDDMIEFIKNYWKKSEFFSCLFLDLSKIEPRSKMEI